MGVFARKLTQEARRFATNVPAHAARQFGRKLTSFARTHGQTVSDVAEGAAGHADLLGLDSVSKGLRTVGNKAGQVRDIARLLDENQPKAAMDKALIAVGKYY